VSVVNNPDRELVALPEHIVASSDGWVLDRAERWVNLASLGAPHSMWHIDLACDADE
jgi:hypothetical protein